MGRGGKHRYTQAIAKLGVGFRAAYYIVKNKQDKKKKKVMLGPTVRGSQDRLIMLNPNLCT